MYQHRDLRLVPDWPRIRQLAAKKLGKSEDEISLWRKVTIHSIKWNLR